MSDDGHGPQHGCTFQKCGNPEVDLPCPFLNDKVAQEPARPECAHEWYQLQPYSGFPEFYCRHCAAITRPTTT